MTKLILDRLGLTSFKLKQYTQIFTSTIIEAIMPTPSLGIIPSESMSIVSLNKHINNYHCIYLFIFRTKCAKCDIRGENSSIVLLVHTFHTVLWTFQAKISGRLDATPWNLTITEARFNM